MCILYFFLFRSFVNTHKSDFSDGSSTDSFIIVYKIYIKIWHEYENEAIKKEITDALVFESIGIDCVVPFTTYTHSTHTYIERVKSSQVKPEPLSYAFILFCIVSKFSLSTQAILNRELKRYIFRCHTSRHFGHHLHRYLFIFIIFPLYFCVFFAIFISIIIRIIIKL